MKWCQSKKALMFKFMFVCLESTVFVCFADTVGKNKEAVRYRAPAVRAVVALTQRPSQTHGTHNTVMPKRLRLKRTPVEQAEHDFRKARKASKKAASKQRRACDMDLDSPGTQTPKHSSGLDAEFNFTFPDPGPATFHNRARATVEDGHFQQKLWDAFEEDDRLDGIETRMNEYAHVPRWWRGVGIREYDLDGTGGLDEDPRFMNDDEYAEWVRVGIWR